MNKKSNSNKIRMLYAISVILALSSVFTCVCSALSFSYSTGKAYRNSYYYKAASSYKLTGDVRYDLISLAFTQLGYHSGDSDDEMHGENILGTKSFAEYNRIYGKTDNGQGNGTSYGYYWCCCFVSWCMRQVGVDKAIVPTMCASRKMISALEKNGQYKEASSGYTPICGDMIFFMDADGWAATHIGFVVGVKDNLIYTIEGNANNNVMAKCYNADDPYILGFSCIDFERVEDIKYDFPLAVNEEMFFPIKTVREETNVYSAPGKTNELVYTFAPGERLEVLDTSGCWAKVSTPNGYGWCDSDFCEKIVPEIAYAVKYYLCGGTGGALNAISYGGEAITISSNAPIRAGYTFKGWAESPDGKVKYKPSDIYQGEHGDSLKRLYAVWEPVVHTVKYLDADGNVLVEEKVNYGGKTPSVKGPSKSSDESFDYKFKEWSPYIEKYVYEDAVYTPVYTSTPVAKVTTAPQTTAPQTTVPPETTVQTQAQTTAPVEEPATSTIEETTFAETVPETIPSTDIATTDILQSETEAPKEDPPTEQTDYTTKNPTTDALTTTVQGTTGNQNNGSEKANNTIITVIIVVVSIAAVSAAAVFIVMKKKRSA